MEGLVGQLQFQVSGVIKGEFQPNPELAKDVIPETEYYSASEDGVIANNVLITAAQLVGSAFVYSTEAYE